MIPAAFDYAAAASVEEAIGLLEEHGEDSKLLAGGHSLIPLMKLRLAVPTFLVDLGRVPGLSYVRDSGKYVTIGAMTTHYMIESSALLKQRLPLLSTAAGMVGDMQVRNRGTIGGSLAHADPASDLPSVALALDATVVARGAGGERLIPAREFFRDLFESALRTDEVLTEVRIPYLSSAPAQAYQKFRQRAADWALVGSAVSVVCNNGSIERASVVLTNVGTTPRHAVAVESALAHQPATRETVQRASELASDGLDPSPELKASPDYKRHLARVLTRRALTEALALG